MFFSNTLAKRIAFRCFNYWFTWRHIFENWRKLVKILSVWLFNIEHNCIPPRFLRILCVILHMIQMLKYFWVIKLCSMFINVKLCRKCSENDKLLTFKKKKNWNSKFLLGFEFRCTGIIRNTTGIDIFSSLIFYKYWGANIALSPIVL